MNRTPGVTPIREITLAAINGALTRIRERLEAIEARLKQTPASASALSALEMQVKALQAGGSKTTTVVQQAAAAPGGSAASIPEVDTDPATPAAGDAWVLRTLVNPAGTLQGFAGGFPLVLADDQNRFDLFIATSEGAKRVQIA